MNRGWIVNGVLLAAVAEVLTGEPVHELAQAFGVSRATAYRYLAKLSSQSGIA